MTRRLAALASAALLAGCGPVKAPARADQPEHTLTFHIDAYDPSKNDDVSGVPSPVLIAYRVQGKASLAKLGLPASGKVALPQRTPYRHPIAYPAGLAFTIVITATYNGNLSGLRLRCWIVRDEGMPGVLTVAGPQQVTVPRVGMHTAAVSCSYAVSA